MSKIDLLIIFKVLIIIYVGVYFEGEIEFMI